MSSKKYRNQGMGIQAVNRQEGQYVYTNRSQIPAPPPCCQTPQAKVYLFYTVPNLYWITIEYWSGRRHVHLERLDIFQIAILLEGTVLKLTAHMALKTKWIAQKHGRTHLFTGMITTSLGVVAFLQHPFDAQFGESFFVQVQKSLPLSNFSRTVQLEPHWKLESSSWSAVFSVSTTNNQR